MFIMSVFVTRSGRLHVVFVLGSVFENPGELAIVKVSLFVNGSLSEELVHIFISEAISHGGQQLSQVIFMNETCADEGQTCSQSEKTFGFYIQCV